MDSSKTQRRRSVIIIAALMIGLMVGAGAAYMILQTQLSQLRNDLGTARRLSAPNLPAFVSVSLDPKSTALLLLDFTASNCYRRAPCNATLPNVQALLAKARTAKLPILFTALGRVPVTELSNRTGETVISNDRWADKFYGTELEAWLRDKQVKTVVIAGLAANGAVLYTAFSASLRGFTVVVVADGLVSDSEYIQTYTFFQLLNQPGRVNVDNKPLAPNAVTLSTVSLIQFGS
jgi:nicotinamidase-related amidase